MIRGTNKRIIEINGEDGSAFERIVLFLRPEQEAQSEEKMLKMAEDYADGLFKSRSAVSMLPKPAYEGLSIKRVLLICLGVLVAASVLALCYLLL